MRKHTRLMIGLLAMLGFAVVLPACEREIAHTEETKISDDGTVKTKEKTVTESDGRTTVTEEKKTIDPD